MSKSRAYPFQRAVTATTWAVIAIAIAGCTEQPTESIVPGTSASVQEPIREGTYGKPESVGTASTTATTGLMTVNLSVHTATELAEYLAGPGVTVSDVVYAGALRAAGMFSGGTGIIGFEDGIILSSGNIAYVGGTNTSASITYDNGQPGNAALTALANYETYDRSILTFKFIPDASRVYFEYVFASEEYNEWVNSSFNDVFAFWVNGVNCALINGEPVSVNTINHGDNASGIGTSNPSFYINNDPHYGGVPEGSLRQTEMDGLTVKLTCEADVNPGVLNTMRLAIADAGDAILDANVFIRRSSLSTEAPKPNAPSGPAATPVSPTQIDVTWNDVSTNETSFRVQRRSYIAGAWTAWASLVNTSANETSHSDTGLAPESKHQYRVRACNAGGCSAYVTSPSATTYDDSPTPARPLHLAGVASTTTQVDLTWTDASWNETHFTLQRRQAIEGGYSTWTTIYTLIAGVEQHTDASLTAGTSYQYRIRACNDAGCSSYSTIASVATPVPTPPAAPTNVSAYAYSGTEVLVNWTDQSNNETRFMVQRQTKTDGVWGTYVLLTSTLDNATSYYDYGLTAGTTYRYRVRACNDAGCSSYAVSNEITTPSGPPAAPTGVAAAVVSSTAVDLSWTDVATDETYYVIQRKQKDDGVWSSYADIYGLPPDATEHHDTGLVPGKQYQYRVRACNGAGCSTWGIATPVTTPAS